MARELGHWVRLLKLDECFEPSRGTDSLFREGGRSREATAHGKIVAAFANEPVAAGHKVDAWLDDQSLRLYGPFLLLNLCSLTRRIIHVEKGTPTARTTGGQ